MSTDRLSNDRLTLTQGFISNMLGVRRSGMTEAAFKLEKCAISCQRGLIKATLSLSTYRPEEKDKAQAALNFCVLATLAVSSLASGVLVTTQGWALLNWGSLLPVAAIGGALAWLALRNARPATA